MKIGVVGYGSIGQRHVRNILILGHEAKYYDPLHRSDVRFERNIYEECDAVVIATPTSHHVAAIRACAERGKPMLVEKPITRIAAGVSELLDLAVTNKAIVMMGNNLRFNPCVKQAKEWLDAGHAGDPIWAQFTCSGLATSKTYQDDGVILNTGAHEVDLALHLFGPAVAISASADCGDGAASDIMADFVIRHECDVRSSFHLDFVTRNDIREAWIVGDEKNIGIDFIGRRTSLGSMTASHGGSWDDDYIAEMRAFIDRIDGKDVPGATGDDGLATLEVLTSVRLRAGLK